MKIVVTDGYVLNPGDISWGRIEAFGELVVYERTSPELVAERCRGAEIVLVNKTPVNKEALIALPHLKLISILATGYNMIDIGAARQQGVTVCNAPAYGTASVAQHTFALILELTNHVGLHSASVAAGDWGHSKDWSYNKTNFIGLEGKTMGIVGFGNIGRQTAAIAEAFGMKILYYSNSKKEGVSAEYVSLHQLFSQSDVISLHCPLTPSNNRFVNRDMLGLMKSSAMLINTARGALVNEDDLTYALNNNVIAGAGLDVLSAEPPAADNPLLAAKNCIITPHNAWMNLQTRLRIMDITVKNIQAFMSGSPLNVVN